eukprot:gene16300-22488_t
MRCAGIQRCVQRLYRNPSSRTMTFCVRVGGGFTCIDTYGEDPITFFFAAVPGDFSSSAEAKWVLHNMKDLENVTLFRAHYSHASTGLLMEETYGVDAIYLYGQCMFHDVPPGTHELLDELYAAANSKVTKDITRQRSQDQLEYDYE